MSSGVKGARPMACSCQGRSLCCHSGPILELAVTRAQPLGCNRRRPGVLEPFPDQLQSTEWMRDRVKSAWNDDSALGEEVMAGAAQDPLDYLQRLCKAKLFTENRTPLGGNQCSGSFLDRLKKKKKEYPPFQTSDGLPGMFWNARNIREYSGIFQQAMDSLKLRSSYRDRYEQ